MNPNQLALLYRKRFADHVLARKDAIWRTIYGSFLKRYVAPGDTVVDVASGYGEFINHVRARRRIAIDLNPDARRSLEAGIEFHQAAATQVGELVAGQADLLFTSNFLEHLPDKATLDTFLGSVRRALKPGGRYLILGPNLRYLAGAYWDFYDHHLGLTDKSLAEALHLAGFEIERSIDRFLPYTTQGALPTHPALVWLYLRLPPVWPLLGKQFFIVARKPADAHAR
ncbi:class I SAM-dependent methyltransferase [Burkholderia stagnalis]|uniref:Class I SAM-dependent methyltransferase n=1 Tax=Burkholderia stagnalis TaxID=1503054 RepID=A0A3P0EB05_9BURK|nr:class I SAM-dependent methyltransferase [Burkholderia stagnalis]KAB0637201.1 class I SAM-dependent methyltransferase [Burkholderia stagnalis]MDY7802439.1 class I SAM-dependent methyltransferase [Burkholderia stagnalis]RQQ16869.1 class I SAM-dependent methyltransferase [Burkholderia stagnalis]RQQ20775.1 class I SAM-dependent methyltransferase [Burkholderia stagnalis]RQQ35839.1 class I SAM-dependent methyltransferase [Burkholderia stagnalis]